MKALLTSGHTSARVALAGWDGVASAETAARAGFGAMLASYRFDGYRTKLKPEQKSSLTNLIIDIARVQPLLRPIKPLPMA